MSDSIRGETARATRVDMDALIHESDVAHIPIPDESVTVVVVDDQTLMGLVLVDSLQADGFRARLVFPNSGEAILAELSDKKPDVVLLDLDLGPLGDAIPLIAPLCDVGSAVIMITGSFDELAHAACLEEGASGVVNKDASLSDLRSAIATAATGHPLYTDEERFVLLGRLRKWRANQAARMAPFESLTSRESEVLRALGRGMSAATIADESCVSVTTVRSQISAVLHKLQASSQLEAVALATEVRWLHR